MFGKLFRLWLETHLAIREITLMTDKNLAASAPGRELQAVGLEKRCTGIPD